MLWGNLFAGFMIGALVTTFVAALISAKSKSAKIQQDNFSKYYKIDDLWLKTGVDKVITFNYNNKALDLKVRCNRPINNTNLRVYSIYINSIECATCVKLMDGESSYYNFCTVDDYDEVETWKIIEYAYYHSKQKENEGKEKPKKSILEEIK